MRYPRNKYNAIKTMCYQGHKHASRLEAQFCDMLERQRKSGVIAEYKTQVKYPLIVNGKLVCNHIVDFEVKYADCKVHVIETKGMPTAIWKLKKKLFNILYPHIHYEIVS